MFYKFKKNDIIETIRRETRNINSAILITAVLLLTAVLLSKAGGKFGIPSLLVFIVIGILSGTDGFGGIYFDNFYLAQFIGIIALIFILFMGGLSVKPKEIIPIFSKGLSLATVGVFVTALTVGFVSNYFLKLSLWECLLLGAIVSSTDAAAVFSVLRAKNISLKHRLRPLLEFESGSNDPMAVFLTVGIISLITGALKSPWLLVGMFFQQMIVGIILGFIIAKISVWLINKIKLEYDGLYIVITISAVLFCYSLASFLGGNGFMCVYVCGLVMSASNFVHKNTLQKFHDGIAWIMQIGMFLILGLLVFVKEVLVVAVPALIVSLILIFIARPLSVFIALLPFKMRLNDKLMIAWVGLRGAAPIVLATFPLMSGIEHSHDIFNVVFFVVVISVLLQSTTIPAIARLLKVSSPIGRKHHSLLEYEPAGTNNKMIEFTVPADSKTIGKTIVELELPEQCIIAMIFRSNDYIIPSGSTVIEAEDVLFVLMDNKYENEVRKKICTGKDCPTN